MEQKLLRAYTTGGMISSSHLGVDSGGDVDGGGDGANRSRRVGGGYVDNPVLVWSLALMWAFVLLIVGHSKIVEWVEGEDPGRLADIVDWLFN